MSPTTRLLLYALLAVIALIVLIARFTLHPFVALITVSLILGIVAGMQPGAVVKAFQDGVAGVLGFIAIVVGLGTMLGKMMAESGGATRIATTLIARFGEQRVHWAIMFVAFIVGIPVFFQVGFVLLIPLVFTIARRSGLSLVKIGIPLVAGLSVVHGMVPPHPAATLAVVAYHADLGRTIAYAIVVGLPTAALAGPIFASWIAPRIQLPADNPIGAQLTGETGEMPGFGISLFTVLLPVILMLGASAADVVLANAHPLRRALDFIGGPIVALLVALLFSFWSLGYRQHFTRDQILKFANDCLAPTAAILLIIGAGGGFNRVLLDSGVGKAIADLAVGSHTSPLLLAWGVAALIRVATGSATVAMTTSAGIVAPIAAVTPGTSPELLVLATGAGSLVLSHVNDSGFWLIKEFFNMTVPQTLKTWTVAETIIGVAGLAFTLLLSLLVGCAPRDKGSPELSARGWVDITASLDPATTPVYAGDAPLKFDFLKDMRKGDKLTLSAYSMGAHSGTHIDAPMHFINTGTSVDQLTLEPLIGPALVIDIPDSVQAIDAAELSKHDWKGTQRVLFRTRSSLRGWMDSAAFHRDFAYVAPDAAQLLADAGVVLVGVDYISAEQFGASAPRTHQILLGRGIPIVEGLDLRSVQAGNYDLIVLPIKVRGHEGAPARAIARPASRTAPRR